LVPSQYYQAQCIAKYHSACLFASLPLCLSALRSACPPLCLPTPLANSSSVSQQLCLPLCMSCCSCFYFESANLFVGCCTGRVAVPLCLLLHCTVLLCLSLCLLLYSALYVTLSFTLLLPAFLPLTLHVALPVDLAVSWPVCHSGVCGAPSAC
jgi:hypothetical protein